jgi:hypothetical protein
VVLRLAAGERYSPVWVYYRMRNFVALSRIHIIRWRWKLRNAGRGLCSSIRNLCLTTIASLPCARPRAACGTACAGAWGRGGD